MAGKVKINFLFGVMDQPQADSDILYHYCSMDSFVNIIKNKSIWFGDLKSMNDPSEMFLRNVNFPAYILALYNKEPFEFVHEHNGYKNNMAEYLQPSQIEYSIMDGGKHSNSLFAFCLSNQCNDLSQWRLYGDNGCGVCLGFKKSTIEKFISNNDGFYLQSVQYFKSTKEVVEKIAKDILNNLKTMYENNQNEELEKYRLEYTHNLINEWPKYKVKDYSSENETRIVYKLKTSLMGNIDASKIAQEDKNIELRLKNNNLVEYVSVNLLDLGLESITLGPTNGNNKEAINLLLAKHDIDVKSSKIYKSTIPYRN